ncbi:hypothetical protein Tco_0465064 [Tanacetum coccineum]
MLQFKNNSKDKAYNILRKIIMKTNGVKGDCQGGFLVLVKWGNGREMFLSWGASTYQAAYVFLAAEEEDTHEPLTYQEEVACKDSSKWKAAMEEEMDSLRKNQTYELVDHPARQKLVSCKWLFKIKEGIEGAQKPSKAEIGSTKSLLKKEFDMKELVEAKKILGMEARDRSCKILRDCSYRDCDVERTRKVPYANAVESLMYLMVCARPGKTYAISTENVGLVYGTNHGNHVDVTCFVDLDYAKDLDKGREVLDAKTVKVMKVGTEHNAADVLKKVFAGGEVGGAEGFGGGEFGVEMVVGG